MHLFKCKIMKCFWISPEKNFGYSQDFFVLHRNILIFVPKDCFTNT